MKYCPLPCSTEQFFTTWRNSFKCTHQFLLAPTIEGERNLLELIHHFSEYPITISLLKMHHEETPLLFVSSPFMLEYEWNDLLSDCIHLAFQPIEITRFLSEIKNKQSLLLIKPESLEEEIELERSKVIWDYVKLSISSELRMIAA